MEPEKNQYDFITNPTAPSTKKSGSSKKTRIIIAVVGAIVLIIGFKVVGAFISSAGEGEKTMLISLAQQQATVIDLADQGQKKALSPDTKSYALTAKLTLTTSQQELTGILNKKVKKLGSKSITASKDADTDAKLTTAGLNNRYDEAFVEVLNSKLTDYQQALQDSSSQLTSKTEKQFLTNANEQITLLLNNKQ